MGILKYYYKPDDKIDHQIEDVLSLEKPDWWSKLPPISNGNRDRFKFIKENWKYIISGDADESNTLRQTAKTCPAFVKLFQHSALIKFPCDVLLETSENGEYRWRAKNRNTLFKDISIHPPEQVSGHLTDYMALKFEFNLFFSMKDSICWYTDPIYYKPQPYSVVPGIVKSDGMLLNVISFFEKKNEQYIFQADSPLALLTFSDKIEKIEFNEDITAIMRQSRWERGKRFFYGGSTKKWV